MSGILSKSIPAFDTSATSIRAAACDLGEVIAMLAGGVKPDPEATSRLAISLRALQGFLLFEAEQQEGRDAIAKAFASIGVEMVGFGSPPPFIIRQVLPAQEMA